MFIEYLLLFLLYIVSLSYFCYWFVTRNNRVTKMGKIYEHGSNKKEQQIN